MNTVVSDLVHFLTHPMRFVHGAHSSTASIRPPQVQKFLDSHPSIVPSVSKGSTTIEGRAEEEDRRAKFIRCIVAMARCVNTTKKNPRGAAIVSMSDDEVEQLFSKLHQALVTATQVAQQQMQQQMQQQQQQQQPTTNRRPVTRSTSKSTDPIPDDLIVDCIAFVVDGAEEVLSQLDTVDLHFLRMQTILLQLLLCAGERVLPILLSKSEYVSKWIAPLLRRVRERDRQGEADRTVLQIYAAHTLRMVSFMINRYEMCVIIARNAFLAERERRKLEGKSRKKKKKNDEGDLDERERKRREFEVEYGELIDDKDDLDMFDKDRMERERQKRLALEKARELEEELRLQETEGGGNEMFDEDSDETLRAMRDVLFTTSFIDMLAETIASNVWPDEDDLVDTVDVYSFVLERSAALLAIGALQELLHTPKVEYRRVEVCLMYAKSAVGSRMIPAIFDSVSANTQGLYKRDMVSTTLEIFSSIAQTVVCCNALEESGSTEAAVNLLIRLTFGDEYFKSPSSSRARLQTITENPDEKEEEEEESADAEEEKESADAKPTPFIAEHSNHFLNHAISVVCYVIGMSGCNYKKIAKRLHRDISFHEHDEHALLRSLMVQLKRAAFVPNVPEDPSSNFKLTVYSALASILLHADVEEIFKLDEQEQLRLASLIAIDLQVSAKGSYYEQPTRTGTGLFSSPWVQYYGAVSLLHVILDKIGGDERASPFLRKLLDSNVLSLLKNVAIDWKKPKHLRNAQKDSSKSVESSDKSKSRRVRGAARRKPAVDLEALRAQIAAKKKAEAAAAGTQHKNNGTKMHKSKSKKHEKEIEMVDESEHDEDEEREDSNEELSEESDIDESEEEEEDDEPYVPGQDEPYYFKYWVQPSQLALNALVQALKKDTDEVNVAKAAEQFDKDRSLVKLIRALEQSIEKQRPSESKSSFKDLRWILYLVVAILVLPYIYRVLRPMLRG